MQPHGAAPAPAPAGAAAAVAAAFYVELVGLNGDAAHGGSAQAQQQQQQQQQQQEHASSSVPPAAAPATHAQQQQQQPAPPPPPPPQLFVRPVRFAAPIVLDAETGVETLPPLAQRADSSACDGGGGGGGSLEPADVAARYQTAPPRQQQQQQQRRAPLSRPLDGSNVGFKLLKAAGWREGSGLGRDEQGRTAPLAAAAHKGSRGLGFAPQQQHEASAAAGADGGAGSSSAQQQQQQQQQPPAGPVLGAKRAAALVAAELAAEGTEAKVRRVRQVAAAEASARRGRAIERLLAREFNAPALAAESADANPLAGGRRSRLTATNPLLD